MLNHITRLIFAIALIAFAQPGLAQGAPLPAASPQPANSRPYTVNAGDELDVYVWGEERLQRTIRVLPDGTFNFPLVGRVQAEGQQLSQIEAQITRGLAPQYREQVPQVTVSVSKPSGLQFSVMGRVRSAGTFTPGRYVNALEALSMAGGPDEFADLGKVSIIRKSRNGLTIIRANLQPAFKGGARDEDIVRNIPELQSGDVVIVP